MGCPQEQFCIGAGVPSLSRIYFSKRKLPATRFVGFVRLPSGADQHMCRFSTLLKLKHLHVKSGLATKRIYSMWDSSYINLLHKQPVHREHWVALRVFCPRFRRGLGGKKGKIAFWRNCTLGLVFILWIEYMLQRGSSQPLVMWSLRDWYQARHLSP